LNEAQAERVRQMASQRARYRGRRASEEPFKLKFDAGAERGRFERYCLRFGIPFQGVQ